MRQSSMSNTDKIFPCTPIEKYSREILYSQINKLNCFVSHAIIIVMDYTTIEILPATAVWKTIPIKRFRDCHNSGDQIT